MKKILAFAFLISMSACHSVYKDRLEKIEVPIHEDPPAPAKVEEKKLPIYELTENSSRDEIAKAFWATIEILDSRSTQFEESVKPFDKEEN